MNWSEIQIWQLLAGLGLFLFGMRMLETSLKSLAGRSYKLFLRKHTGNRIKAVLSGTLITAILQSSSMVVLLVMSFAGAGIIGLSNGIGIVLGANLGTTFTGWIVSLFGFKLDIKSLIFPFLALGGLGAAFAKTERWMQISSFLMGFSFMFLGLGFMKDGFSEFVTHIDMEWVRDRSGFTLFLVAFVLTGLIQSSSASMMIFLTALATGILSFEQSLYMVIGADLGTTITALIGTIGAKPVRQQIGWSQFIINVMNAILAFTLMPVLVYIIQKIIGLKDPLFSMVAFHSLMNLTNIIVLLPFLTPFTGMIEKWVKGNEKGITEYIQKANPEEANSAAFALREESVRFIRQAIDTNRFFFDIPHKLRYSGIETAYTALQQYESALAQFYNKVLQNPLHPEEVAQINHCILAIRYASHSVKDIKDIRHNLAEIQSSTDEKLYAFYEKLKEDQKSFYNNLDNILDAPQQKGPSDMRAMLEMQGSIFEQETAGIYSMNTLVAEPEMAISSILNMVREINNSNREIIRAVSSFVMQTDVPEN